jgi:UDP-N-acetyl-D-mannosaminuronic acid dehydrogenase
MEEYFKRWKVEKIGVIGPGIVGMPMAALLANAKIKIGTDKPAQVCVVQRNSSNSGWKVQAINEGKSVIGGIEPGLNDIVEKNVKEGLLVASSDFNVLSDVDVILVSIQTDKDGLAPDYVPLFGGLTSLAEALKNRPENKIPIVIFESTLAPSSMMTVITEHFKKFGLIEGKDILLGNSPNRVMPGRLVERVTHSDKLVAGLNPVTPKMIQKLYSNIVTNGILHMTNSLTAEIVKTLENAYRDVRIAFSSEVVRYCDNNDIDYYLLRDQVNNTLAQTDNASSDPNAVPSGGLLIPAIGVGGHCLPKDGILLWWRMIENGANTKSSLILNSRNINDDSPIETIKLFEKNFGEVKGKTISILGTAYRFNSEDTRNSPSIQLALELQKRGAKVVLHDPYVKPDDQNLVKFHVETIFTQKLDKAIEMSNFIIIGTAHKIYTDNINLICENNQSTKGILDGCNIFKRKDIENKGIAYCGIGRGKQKPDKEFTEFIVKSFKIMETGVGNEVKALCSFFNENYAKDDFNKVDFSKVQELAASCSTGCIIADQGIIDEVPLYKNYYFQLVKNAFDAQNNM